MYKILFWTPYFGSDIRNYVPNAGKHLYELGCAYYNCRFTWDRNQLSTSDAVFFHAWDLSLRDLPSYRRLDQYWILQNLEPPCTLSVKSSESVFFNWTSHYRSDSDIIIGYGRVTKRNKPLEFMPVIDLTSKTRPVAWIVSNCGSPGGRDDYVRELKRFIRVDVYGKCGPFTCYPKKSDICLQNIAKQYRFYLSFENGICK